MPVKTKAKTSPAVREKARQLLAWAKERASAGANPSELFIVVFGPRGKARITFPTEAELAAFERTSEYEEIRKLIGSAASDGGGEPMNGHHSVTLHLPKSVHATLLAEAAAEGVSLDQLCLSKLVAQLRELV